MEQLLEEIYEKAIYASDMYNELDQKFDEEVETLIQIIAKADGGVVKNIRSDELRDLIIPISPIEEQQRIADNLDQILPLIEELKE